jgi:hypothetical protein
MKTGTEFVAGIALGAAKTLAVVFGCAAGLGGVE